MSLSPIAPITDIHLIKPAYQKRLFKLGIKNLKDLFYYFPYRYNDFSNIILIRDVRIGAMATIQGRITEIKNLRSWRKRMAITEAYIMDKSGMIKAVWYNQPFLIKNIHSGDIVSLAGKVSMDKACYLSNPAYEKIANSSTSQLRHTGRLVPVYSETKGLTSRYLRYLINLFMPAVTLIKDWLPPEVKDSQRLLNLESALRQIHFPDNAKILEQAKRRLAFDELFLIQLNFLRRRLQWENQPALPISFDEGLIKNFVASLPFRLTDAQRRSAWEILKDLQQARPMNRLLQGDVGAGKTVVAGLAMLETVSAGAQTALMAPTEILASQHFITLLKLFSAYDLNIGLLTGAQAQLAYRGKIKKVTKSVLLSKIANGEINILIGTHALIQKKVEFKKLALAVVDEQHRFGVAQRSALQNNVVKIKDGLPAAIPHLLSMTATPIPRTLALAVYGDLDLSLIDEMPPGRQLIITKIVLPDGRLAAYEFIRRQVKAGRQIFVICPRIGEEVVDIQAQKDFFAAKNNIFSTLSVKKEIKAVKQEYQKLTQKVFPDLKVAMLHGQMPAREKNKIMANFSARKINILVSTSVVEVGVDIPNATVMMVEGAERFGLAQLHQFRGRVGRGEHQSYCLLFADSPSGATHARLKALTAKSSGFDLAEIDLELRGPGDFYGAKQWGLPDLSMASLGDSFLVKEARQEALNIIKSDPALENYPLLADKIKKFQTQAHLE